MKEIYKDLKTAVLPLMTMYQTDLTKHDKRNIEANPGTPFLHFTKESNTFLIMLHPGDKYPPAGERIPYLFGTAGRDHILRQHTEVLKSLEEDNRATHYFNGKTLKKIPFEKSVNVLRDYTASIKDQWGVKY